MQRAEILIEEGTLNGRKIQDLYTVVKIINHVIWMMFENVHQRVGESTSLWQLRGILVSAGFLLALIVFGCLAYVFYVQKLKNRMINCRRSLALMPAQYILKNTKVVKYLQSTSNFLLTHKQKKEYPSFCLQIGQGKKVRNISASSV
eukprot:TRINITY_DN11419_c0_g1_i2.p1 TRINITY_DN11419_c0_g1~~TRINITY_DN11419_c0_g1_i2.p1  ORF type:complete len:147 (-),score=1.06 TRINITY_DN11419_c0_g1_i2:99-539(-)